MSIQLYHAASDSIKEIPSGFSFTTFFFGPFPALFRGDLKWAAIITIVQLVAFACFVVPWIFTTLYFSCAYNEKYLAEMQAKGYKVIS